jgi:uncharacterized damage-inducible protein DinB
MIEYTVPEHTVRKYDMVDYEDTRVCMTLDDIVNHLAYIERGYIGDYNFTGDEDDFERYKLHIAIEKAIEIIKSKAESEE